VAQAAPAGDAAAVAQLPRQVAPGQTVPQDEQDATERGAMRDARRSAVMSRWFGWEERLDRFPEVVADRVRRGHGWAYTVRPIDRKNPLGLAACLSEITSKTPPSATRRQAGHCPGHQEPRSPCRREVVCGTSASLSPAVASDSPLPDGTTFGRLSRDVGLPDSSVVPNKLFQGERGTTEQLLGLWTEVASQPEAHDTVKGKHHPDICCWLSAPAHALPEGQRRGIGIHDAPT